MSDEFMRDDKSPKQAEGGQPTTDAKSSEGHKEGKSDYSEFLEAITNSEGKPKYKSVPDALLGAAKAQEHIARLESENAEMRGLILDGGRDDKEIIADDGVTDPARCRALDVMGHHVHINF